MNCHFEKQKTAQYCADVSHNPYTISPYSLTRNRREFLPKERVRKRGEGLYALHAAPYIKSLRKES